MDVTTASAPQLATMWPLSYGVAPSDNMRYRWADELRLDSTPERLEYLQHRAPTYQLDEYLNRKPPPVPQSTQPKWHAQPWKEAAKVATTVVASGLAGLALGPWGAMLAGGVVAGSLSAVDTNRTLGNVRWRQVLLDGALGATAGLARVGWWVAKLLPSGAGVASGIAKGAIQAGVNGGLLGSAQGATSHAWQQADAQQVQSPQGMLQAGVAVGWRAATMAAAAGAMLQGGLAALAQGLTKLGG
jgi:hypothetical protein